MRDASAGGSYKQQLVRRSALAKSEAATHESLEGEALGALGMGHE